VSIVEGRLANVSAALLIGGASTRMGRDKASLTLSGVAMATRLARLLDAMVDDVLLVGGAPPEDAPGRRIADVDGPASSLRGLVSALEAARAPRLLVIATDLPFVTPALLLGLVARPPAGAVVPRRSVATQALEGDGVRTTAPSAGSHPLCGVYDVAAALPVAREHLAAGRLALRAMLDRLQVDFVEGDDLAALDPDGHALDNANTPQEWVAVEARCRAGSR
jgi:molybdopterin-guanine dinucleotide biosynthesis protein A